MLIGRALGQLVVWLVSSPNYTLRAAIDSNMESESNASKKTTNMSNVRIAKLFPDADADADAHAERQAQRGNCESASKPCAKRTNKQTNKHAEFNRAKPALSSSMQMKELRALSPALGSRKAASLTVRICRRQARKRKGANATWHIVAAHELMAQMRWRDSKLHWSHICLIPTWWWTVARRHHGSRKCTIMDLAPHDTFCGKMIMTRMFACAQATW